MTRPRVGGGIVLFLAANVVLGSATHAQSRSAPQLVSPAGRAEAQVQTECPTFSWTHVPGATGYELVVYERTDAAARSDEEPFLRVELPAGASAWTPSAEVCLRAAGRYGWSVGARFAEGEVRWSVPGLFRLIEQRERVAPERDAAGAAVIQVPAQPIALAQPASQEAPVQPVASEAFSPGACTGLFTDVSGPYCPWIELAVADQVVTGCGVGKYCPNNPITRAQVAMLLEKAMRGTDTWLPTHGGGAAAPAVPAVPTSVAIDTLGDVGQYTSITIGADGLGLISYYDVTNHDLKVAHCSNIECTAATITPLDTSGDVGKYTSIMIGSDGLGLISYWGSDGNGDLRVAHCSNINCTAATITNLDLPGFDAFEVAVGTSIAINGFDGFGTIAYYDDSNKNLKVAHCTNILCSARTITTVDSTGDVGSNPSIATMMSTDELGIIYYQDVGGGDHDLKFTICTNPDCTAHLTPVVPVTDPGILGGGPTSMTIGADGRPLVTIPGLVAHCTGGVCSDATWQVRPGIGTYSSVTIGSDGLGLFSHYNDSGSLLQASKCLNIACSLTVTAALDDLAVGSVGLYNAITIGADGLGLVSYYDEANGDLKVAHCPNAQCAWHFKRR